MVEWLERWTWNLEALRCWWFKSYHGQDFCNVHLFRVPRSWTGSVQMKSSMTFLRGYRCIEREKDNLKSREVKRLKEWVLALKTFLVVYLPVPFLLKSSYTPLRMLKCLKLYAPPYKFKQIKTRQILWKYQVILVIAYIFIIKVMNNALWLTFESKRYMYFHNKTWYTCTRCYM